MKPAAIDYEMRAVAFVYVLGWKTAVEASVFDPSLREKMRNAFSSLGSLTEKCVREEAPDLPSRDEFAQFSDSIIISIPYFNYKAIDVARLIRLISGFQSSMILSGFPLRGGITVGPMYHRGATAHALSSASDVSPRVIFSMK